MNDSRGDPDSFLRNHHGMHRRPNYGVWLASTVLGLLFILWLMTLIYHA